MKSPEKNRAIRMLENDRIGLVDGAEQLIRADINSLLCEYFCLKAPPKIKIVGDGEQIYISLEATAEAVKRFNILK